MPPRIVGIIDNFWFNYVGDLGAAGPDRGKGGKFLLLPPGYAGEVPKGYFVLRSKTYGNSFFWCSFLVNGDPKPAVTATRKFAKVYPLAQAGNPPAMKFINVSGKAFNTVPANDFTFSSMRSTTSCRRSRMPHSIRRHWVCSPPSASRKASPSRPMSA